jgi:hypothetical protein
MPGLDPRIGADRFLEMIVSDSYPAWAGEGRIGTPERRREPRLINPVTGNRRADARGAIIYIANCLKILADNLRM